MNAEKVSVVVPIRNEQAYIKNFIDSLLAQDYPKEKLEILLIDGLSEDNTLEIIRPYLEEYEFIKLIKNEKKTVQHALNIGIKSAGGEYVVRMDAHAGYEPNYISQCIDCFKKSGANNVGGPTIAKGFNETQRVISAIYSSPFALGGGLHYNKNFEGYSDTVSWGCFKREYLISLGMYDERLPRSEDDDLNFRITQSGGKIYISPKIKSEYYPKESFTKLFKQYFSYGVWKIAVIKKHRRPLKITQLIPMLFIAFLIIFGIMSFLEQTFLNLFLLGISFYFLLSVFFSFRNEQVNNLKERLLLMWAQFVVHVSYGLGFWVGIFKFWSVKW